MVTGNEYLFDNIDKALEYILDLEQKALAADQFRQRPPLVVRPYERMFLQPAPKKIPLVPVDSLDYPFAAWFNDVSHDKFIMTRLSSGRYSLKPNLRNRKYLFRGETEFHSPCKPNLFRNPKQRRFTAELLRGQEMKLLMLSHPLVQLLDIGVELNGQLCQFEMNLFGLTQHYYNKTRLLDLTSNPQVAKFFATTQYNWEADTYSPITDENHKPGILYYYSLDINEDFGGFVDGNKSRLSTIGLQVFPRSGRQRGFLYNMCLNENFNDVPRLNAVMFKHNAAIATRYCKKFNYGVDLFPDDILVGHWKRENRNTNIVSFRTVLMNKIDNPEMTLADVETEVRSLGFVINDYRPAFTKEEMDEYYDAVWNKNYWIEFCSQIHIPGDKQGKMMKDLLNLPNNPKYRWAFVRDDSHVTNYDKGFIMRVYKECLV